MNKRNKQNLSRILLMFLLAILVLFVNQYTSQSMNKDPNPDSMPTDLVEVHFIDVGQGDAILVEAGDSTLLIDAGENNKGTVVVDYLHNQEIKKLDYIIGTHPHSDHIGGLDTVLHSFMANTVIMPAVSHNTATYEDVLDALEKKNLKITKLMVGDTYELGPAQFTILAPNNSTYDELNDYSIVIKLTYQDTSFLLTGDASSLSEKEMLEGGMDLSADVLKLAHHGSSYSTSNAFLEAVSPSHAVISVGADNEYGHPHSKTLQKIHERNIKLYRTDKQGTVVFTSDGKNISVNTDNYNITEKDLEN